MNENIKKENHEICVARPFLRGLSHFLQPLPDPTTDWGSFKVEMTVGIHTLLPHVKLKQTMRNQDKSLPLDIFL